jgi:transcriptional regulator with XRE-family HTH domain
LREANRWTQEYVAEELGVKPNTLSNYERGSLLPPREVLERAAVLFKIDVRDFFTTEKFTFNFNGPTTASGYIENQHLDPTEVFDLMRAMMERMNEQWRRGEERMETLLQAIVTQMKKG